MKTEVKPLPRGQVELTIEISPEEFQPFLQQAAKKLSEEIKIPGFRPGKAGLDIIKSKVGEDQIWQAALEPAIKKTFIAAIEENKLETVGAPEIDAVKLAPGNPVIYKATANLLPQIKLGDYAKIKIEKKPVQVKDEQAKKVINDLQNMRAKETLVLRAIKKGDKAEIDFESFMDKIPLEHGQHQKFLLIVGGGQFIPGFEDQLIGLETGQTKNFQLKFPENYHQKNIAGKLVDFKVKINAVFSRELPELNDEFAQSLGGFKTLAEAEEKIKSNLAEEAEHEAAHRLEDEMIDKIITASQFGDIPDLLINSEAKKMTEELAYNLEQQGLKLEDYLTHLKKTQAQVLLEFAPQAIKRVKSALVVRAVAKNENLKADEAEIDEEIQKSLADCHHDPEIEKNVKNPAYLDYLKNILTARKVMARLKELMVK
ncbi:MAG: trigger factor [Candidatus Buchananbacteria bacterium RIFCSPLOWO2_02_FULL_46_11b]|uniref:Trigger factor n=1 Tax=Candidatus Buchananbacteria bacterium RIFCSPLOWO2_02_FULL_46_11b TaxID=1797548 RepID=A0A1G1YXS1_9BACT|nr:MAG: trigger factor [Candidatus Buchananbacteria bacterium RIFCSPLOWO2_02_FULL_46_11b]